MIKTRGVLLVSALLYALHCGPARAQVVSYPDLGPAILIAADVLIAPPLIANAVYVAKHVRPPLVWPILGFVLGTAGVALGAGFALPNSSSTDSNASIKVVLGIVMMVEGAADIALGIAALAMPRAKPQATSEIDPPPRWVVTPFLARDVAGRPEWGFALSVGRF